MQSEISLKSKDSVKSIAARHDGHVDGHLNCVALRHGWRRTFSIPPTGPKSMDTLDYATLETVLELHTLRLRSMQLRIFVENPPNSGTWSKVRPWKDDGSLQSVLVKQFFAERMASGTVTNLEVRDGHDREDAVSVRSLAVGSGSRIVNSGKQTKAWLKEHGIPRKAGVPQRNGILHDDEDEDEEALPAEPPAPSRFGALMYAFGLTSEAPPPPPKTAEELHEEQQQEEQMLKKRGWMPPVIRRMTSRRSQKSTRSLRGGNPFFGGNERTALLSRSKSNVHDDGPPTHLGEEHDGEELGVIGDEDAAEAAKTETPNARPARWLRFLGGGSSPQPENDTNAENPFEDGNELSKVQTNTSGTDSDKKLKRGRKNKGKGKAKDDEHFTGAKVVKQPADAFENGPQES